MTQIVEPKPIYRTLTEEEVRKALEDPNPSNPIAAEVTVLVSAYEKSFNEYVQLMDYVPPYVIRDKTRWPIGKVAMWIAMQNIRKVILTDLIKNDNDKEKATLTSTTDRP